MDALNEITSRVLYELIEKKVSPILDEIYTDEKIKQIIENTITDNVLKDTITSKILDHFDVMCDNDMINVINRNKKVYLQRLDELLIKILDEKSVKDNIYDSIKERYFKDVTENCIVEDMFTDVFRNYTFELIKKPNKKS